MNREKIEFFRAAQKVKVVTFYVMKMFVSYHTVTMTFECRQSRDCIELVLPENYLQNSLNFVLIAKVFMYSDKMHF